MRFENESGLTKRDAYKLGLIERERYKRDYYLNCMRCGHAWHPFVDRPKACPSCGSKIWDKLKTTNPREVTKVLVYEEAHQYYGLHYHIKPFPSFPQNMIVDLLMEQLKSMLKTNFFDEKLKQFEGEDYRIYIKLNGNVEDGFSVGKRINSSRYFNRLFKVTGKKRIHVSIDADEGTDLLIKSLEYIFSDAKIELQEWDSSHYY